MCVQAEHIDEGRGGDPDVDLPMLFVDRRLVRPSCERELLNELQRAGVIDVKRILHLARAVVVEPLRVCEEIVRPGAALDDAYDLVLQRVNNVLDVTGVVALQDPDNHPVVGVEAWDPLSRERCPEERRSQEQQEETSHPRGVHQRPPKAVGTLVPSDGKERSCASDSPPLLLLHQTKVTMDRLKMACTIVLPSESTSCLERRSRWPLP